MSIKDLYQSLEKAYTVKNLNRISLTLINLYKEKQFSILQKIAEIIEDFYELKISSNGKGFSKLIMLLKVDQFIFKIGVRELYSTGDVLLEKVIYPMFEG